MTRQARNILKSCLELVKIKLFGEQTTLYISLQNQVVAGLFGIKIMVKITLRTVNWHTPHLIVLLGSSHLSGKVCFKAI